jgi:hypothetical protein
MDRASNTYYIRGLLAPELLWCSGKEKTCNVLLGIKLCMSRQLTEVAELIVEITIQLETNAPKFNDNF